jgi:hypothetical protein
MAGWFGQHWLDASRDKKIGIKGYNISNLMNIT